MNLYLQIELCFWFHIPDCIQGAVRNNFPRFYCWQDLMLSEFQYHFCSCPEAPGQKHETGFLFNTNMNAL